MITCTGCGKKNGDENLFCDSCGKKLQSSRQNAPLDDSPGGPLSHFAHKGVPEDRWVTLKRMLEAWGCIIVLGGSLVACLAYEKWWPMYPVVALLGLYLWMRRI